mmetsp:Transcript_14084/g.48509  ORF Transcript_14084/g.48509 Transcript_14084/m.48509 type:complete len:222 (+) Transcript_14084:454-1119(+)
MRWMLEESSLISCRTLSLFLLLLSPLLASCSCPTNRLIFTSCRRMDGQLCRPAARLSFFTSLFTVIALLASFSASLKSCSWMLRLPLSIRDAIFACSPCSFLLKACFCSLISSLSTMSFSSAFASFRRSGCLSISFMKHPLASSFQLHTQLASLAHRCAALVTSSLRLGMQSGSVLHSTTVSCTGDLDRSDSGPGGPRIPMVANSKAEQRRSKGRLDRYQR